MRWAHWVETTVVIGILIILAAIMLAEGRSGLAALLYTLAGWGVKILLEGDEVE